MDKSGPSKRAIVGWGMGMLVVLGLAWLVGAVVVPVWQVQAALRDFPEGERSAPQPWQVYTDRLGGPERAAARLGAYLRVPQILTTHRYGAARLLSTCGKPAVPFLVRALGDSSDERIPRTAAYGLGQIGPEAREAVAALEASLTSEDAYLRVKAASALYRIDSTSMSALRVLHAALGDERPSVRMCALGEVATCGRAIGLRPLVDALNDPEDGVRSYAAYALRQFSPLPDDVLDDLVKALADTDEQTRWSAAVLLGDMETRAEKIVPSLEKALNDKSRAVRAAAAEALKKIKAPSTPSTSSGQASSPRQCSGQAGQGAQGKEQK